MTASPTMSAATLTIDLGAIVANYRELQRLSAPAGVGAVVKADAYGLGLVPVGRTLYQAGCRTFFVATPDEALALKDALASFSPRDDAHLFVLNGLSGARADLFVARGLVPVLNTLDDIANWRTEAIRQGQTLAAALHVDTGMNRLGLTQHDALRLAGEPDRLRGIALSLIMSHLACAEIPDHPMNARQRHAFDALLGRFPHLPASLANSAGVLLGAGFHYALTRPGLALYGGNPAAARANPFRATVTLKAPILQIRDVAKGETIGYGATHRLAREARIATVAAGYADGYLASLADRGQGVIAGRRVPAVGRISMDLITFDVSALPEGAAKPGAMIELLGPAMPVDEVAQLAGTITYEILTRLGARSLRVYNAVPGGPVPGPGDQGTGGHA